MMGWEPYETYMQALMMEAVCRADLYHFFLAQQDA